MSRKAKEVSAPSPKPKASQEVLDQKLALEHVDIEKLVPNPWNPQTMNQEEFDRLVDEISSVGFIAPIQVVPLDDGTYQILGGEHRWKAAKVIGLKTLPCAVLTDKKWREDDLKKFTSTRLNLIQGRLDPTKFLTLYNEMVEKYGSDAMSRLFGFTDDSALQKVLGGVRKGIKRSLPKEMQNEFDKAAKDVKTVEDLSKIIQNLFAKFGSTVSQNFMIFSYGAKQHLYIAMNKEMKAGMDKVVECCRKSGEDINDFMAPLIEMYVEEAKDRLKRMEETAEKIDSSTSTS